MEDNGASNDKRHSADDTASSSGKRKRRKNRGESGSQTNEANNQHTNGRKKSWRKSWRSASPLTQLSLIIGAVAAISAAAYLVSYIVVSIRQKEQIELQHAPIVINSRSPEFLEPFTCNPKTRRLRTGAMQTFAKNVGTACDRCDAVHADNEDCSSEKDWRPVH